MKRVLLLGATSHISTYLIPMLLTQDVGLTLFARHGKERLKKWTAYPAIKVVNGDWNECSDLQAAMAKQNIVFLATSQFAIANRNVVTAMNKNHVKRLIAAGCLGIEDEVAGKFGQWNHHMMGNNRNLKAAAAVIKDSGLNYTLMRMAWLYDGDDEEYELIPHGQPFYDTQLSRKAAARFVADIVSDPALAAKQSVGVGQPHTDWAKPSFY